jgi:mannose-6-phosphate isomerase-like protein (cupin superfamily)
VRRIITGAGPEGRSRVESIEEITDTGPVGEVAMTSLWDTTPGPLERPATAPLLAMAMAAGATHWMVVHMGPGYEHPDHRTDTVDYDLVVIGQAQLVLDEGSVVLQPGDCAVVPGVAHQWRAGPEGCTLSITMVGLDPL